jgi:lysophospholipase L1-like esterase
MPKSLVLLGDSIIDNQVYVRPGELDVAAQVRRRLPGWRVDQRALDGAEVADVMAGQLKDAFPKGSAVFLSAGGNDALGAVDLLIDPTPTTFAAAMEQLRRVRDDFASRYAALADAVAAASGRVMAATIYHPAFTGAEAALQAPAEGALAAYDDVIQREALRCGFRVLELRTLFDHPDDYANPIEPSAKGGDKIARAIADWLG